jgi:hypothetical protein
MDEVANVFEPRGAFDFHELPRLTAAPQHAKLQEADILSELGVNVVCTVSEEAFLCFHVVATIAGRQTTHACNSVTVLVK